MLIQYPSKILAILLTLTATVIFGACTAQNQSPPSEFSLPNSVIAVDSLTIADLETWWASGDGDVVPFRGRAMQLTEHIGSEGVNLISPHMFAPNSVIQFDVMTLRAATVLVFLHSLHDVSESGPIRLSPDFDGSLGRLPAESSYYMFAFHNAPHFRFPFVNKRTPKGMQLLQETNQSYMQTGAWYTVEIGRYENNVWLRINDKLVLNTVDDNPLRGGHIGFRIRGSGTEIASTFIKDVVIKTLVEN